MRLRQSRPSARHSRPFACTPTPVSRLMNVTRPPFVSVAPKPPPSTWKLHAIADDEADGDVLRHHTLRTCHWIAGWWWPRGVYSPTLRFLLGSLNAT